MAKNPAQRLHNHNTGRGAKMAIDQHGFFIRYVSQPFFEKSSARQREIQLKKWTRAKKEKLIKGIWK